MTTRWDPLQTASLVSHVLRATDLGSLCSEIHGAPLADEWEPPRHLLRTITCPMAGRNEAWDAVGYIARLLHELKLDALCENHRVFDKRLDSMSAEFVYVRFIVAIVVAGSSEGACACGTCGKPQKLERYDAVRLVRNCTAHWRDDRRTRAMKAFDTLLPPCNLASKCCADGNQHHHHHHHHHQQQQKQQHHNHILPPPPPPPPPPPDTSAMASPRDRRRHCIEVVDAAIARLLGDVQ